MLRLSTILFALALIATPAIQAADIGGVYLVESVTKKGAGKAVDFTWKANGKTQSFAEVTKGKVVLVNIWATWCAPCRKEIPDLVAIHTEMASKGVMVFGISVDQDENKYTMVKNFVEKKMVNYLNIIDNLKIADAYGGIQAIPTSFIVNRNGDIVQKIVGGMSKAQFVAAIEKAL
ncbi:MAG: TlpA family protein disulfide reductase [Ignavibacteriae bacterium]|nr:MAG: TlpA family protein disulfide reductase [Ignavibacteriota bacterium]